MITSNSSQHVQRISFPTSRPLFLYNPLSPGVDHIPMYVASTRMWGNLPGITPPEKRNSPSPSICQGSTVPQLGQGPGEPLPLPCLRWSYAGNHSCPELLHTAALLRPEVSLHSPPPILLLLHHFCLLFPVFPKPEWWLG